MGTNRSLKSGFDVTQQHVPVPILAIAGPLLGLGYIIVLPFIGIAAFVWISGYRATQRLITMWHRLNQATIDTWEKVGDEVVGARDSIQPLIDKLECEYMVVDREFLITQYYTPLLHQNELLEQTAIGRHCFEVSHGRNRPCDSCECECPIRKVLETNEKVLVTHYHENPLEGKGRQRLVKVLASPVRDSQGNVTQVAELIWDAGRVN